MKKTVIAELPGGRAGQARAAFCLVWLCLAFCLPARAADTLLTAPFENISGKPQYHWIGESFAVMMADLLAVPGLGIIGMDERRMAYERQGLKPSELLTRASLLRVAETAQANLALIGDYDIAGDQNLVTIAIRARLIETREGRLVGNKVFNYSGPLGDLQVMQGQLAWNILYERDPAMPWSRDKMVGRARACPPVAFESYVKGILTSDLKLREAFLRRAILEYNNDAGFGHYTQALYALGRALQQQGNHAEAARQLGEIGEKEPGYAEARYYYGLALWASGNTQEAAAVYEKLIAAMPLLDVYNNAGALLAAKGDLLGATTVLQRGVELSPGDMLMRFNFGYTLWKAGEFEKAIPQFRAVLTVSEEDGEALYLLARSLAATGKKTEAEQADQRARRFLASYARWEVAPDKIPPPVRLRPDLNHIAWQQLQRRGQSAPARISTQPSPLQQTMDRARQLYAEKKDGDAMFELQKALAADATHAAAHLLRGKIHQRRGEMDNAISALEAAVYWNPRLPEAHLTLGQIFQAKGDRLRALTYGRRALELDPQNREAASLVRQIENDK
ncbi:MAG: tetratricopeptide repeat protein [Blastocatellia bacterium]